MMRKVTRLEMKSVLRLFVVFYALIGLYVAVTGVLNGDDSIVCPFGFVYPAAHAYITVTLNLPHPASWLTAGLVTIVVVFYGLTGAISGVPIVLVYNAVGRWWPLFSAEFAPEAPPPPSPIREELWPSS